MNQGPGPRTAGLAPDEAKACPMAIPESEQTAVREAALDLIRSQRTLVLATCRDNTPWSAPVYYLFHQGCFYFFSSPRSLHIRHSVGHGHSAGTVFADSDRWEQIRGLQMTGRVTRVQSMTRTAQLTALFILRYPIAKSFLHGGDKDVPNLSDKVHLYCFTPLNAYLVSNHNAFGRRLALDPLTFDPLEPRHDPCTTP